MKYRLIKSKISLFIGAFFLLSVTLLGGGAVYASPNTCNWTGAGDGESWSDASNWSNCAGTAPQNGDSLNFDVSGLASPADGNLLNDISNLQVDSIAFTGTNIHNYGYGFLGDGFSLSGGVDNSSGASESINTDITLTADQTFNTDSTLDLGLSSKTLALGSQNLTINSTGGGEVDITSVLTGSGEIDFGSSLESNFIDSNNPGFSGPIVVEAGRLIINASNTDQLGTDTVTVNSGATLQESVNTTGTYSLANPFVLSGVGDGSTGALDVHDFDAGGSTLDFTGAITLAGDAEVSLESANANFSGAVGGCGFSITKKPGSSGTLSGNLTGSCTSDPGDSGSSGISSNTLASGGVSAPKTGYGAPASNGMPAAIIYCLAITGLVAFATGIRKLYQNT